MSSSAVHPGDDRQLREPPGTAVRTVGVLIALCCVGFALVNAAFELTGHFDDGRLADYTVGMAVMDWLVAVLKLVGAAVALLAISRRTAVVSPAVVTVLLWGAFATLGVYALGSVLEAIGIVAGLVGDIEEITLASVAYVLFFSLIAAGYGVLAVSYSRRHRTGMRAVVLGVLGAPALLALVLVAVPMTLQVLGLLPKS
jgi:hypothetical protein